MPAKILGLYVMIGNTHPGKILTEEVVLFTWNEIIT